MSVKEEVKNKTLVMNRNELLAFFEENRELKGNIGIISENDINLYGNYLIKSEGTVGEVGLFMKSFVVAVIPISQIKYVFVRNGSD
mgnify:CR=1 FL=1